MFSMLPMMIKCWGCCFVGTCWCSCFLFFFPPLWAATWRKQKSSLSIPPACLSFLFVALLSIWICFRAVLACLSSAPSLPLTEQRCSICAHPFSVCRHVNHSLCVCMCVCVLLVQKVEIVLRSTSRQSSKAADVCLSSKQIRQHNRPPTPKKVKVVPCCREEICSSRTATPLGYSVKN